MLIVKDLNAPGTIALAIGDRNPYYYEDSKMDGVTEIRVFGDELNLLIKKIKCIPYSEADIQRWFGDHAKFIIANFNMNHGVI